MPKLFNSFQRFGNKSSNANTHQIKTHCMTDFYKNEKEKTQDVIFPHVRPLMTSLFTVIIDFHSQKCICTSHFRFLHRLLCT